MNLISWFRRLKIIVKNHDIELVNNDRRFAQLRNDLSILAKIIKERTTVSADVNFNAPSHVIVIGRYNNHDFIQCYQMKDSHFARIVDQLKHEAKFAQVRLVDSMPQFSATIKREVI